MTDSTPATAAQRRRRDFALCLAMVAVAFFVGLAAHPLAEWIIHA